MAQRPVTFVIFEDFPPLDLVGPHEVFAKGGSGVGAARHDPDLVRWIAEAGSAAHGNGSGRPRP